MFESEENFSSYAYVCKHCKSIFDETNVKFEKVDWYNQKHRLVDVNGKRKMVIGEFLCNKCKNKEETITKWYIVSYWNTDMPRYTTLYSVTSEKPTSRGCDNPYYERTGYLRPGDYKIKITICKTFPRKTQAINYLTKLLAPNCWGFDHLKQRVNNSDYVDEILDEIDDLDKVLLFGFDNFIDPDNYFAASLEKFGFKAGMTKREVFKKVKEIREREIKENRVVILDDGSRSLERYVFERMKEEFPLVA